MEAQMQARYEGYEKERRETTQRIAELEKALRWALPLAQLALESSRLDRLRCGHHDIGAGRGRLLGLWDDEVAALDHANATAYPSLER